MAKTNGRTDGEILKDLMDAIIEHESNRDAEQEFDEEHPDPAFWDKETEEEHDQVVDDVLSTHYRIRDLIREATGDENFNF